MLKRWLAAFGLIAGFLAISAHAEFREGVEYKKLASPQPVAQPGKLEVIEFFWYGCPHCMNVEPYVEDWAKKLPKDVNFRRMHVSWEGRNDIEAHARIFIALNAMGIAAKYQQAVFNAIQKEGIELRREDVLYDWVKKQGIDVEKFKTNYKAFSMNAQLGQLAQAGRDYKVDGVPTFIINGKYTTSPSMTGKEDGTVLQVVDQVLAQERGSNKPATTKPAKKK
ncbi:thiol:disulfide interchange protein DsbA/DsbL [Andreprevotia chitinilytica]|uniref:thiol:disulfide interchange protein DsbA/DsbL n=1 Tax=Andreprevotia chitinilytica TaxID=396808 RepID=UPI0005544D8D|nr:thiol:disulfide interchange protein DsbA/DsbL [Andreprevotia chitinilytica]